MKHGCPKILISNDDGIHANGLRVLIDALRPLGHITVAAPDSPRSGASSSITSAFPLRPVKMREEPGLVYYRIGGTPADCVKIALNVLFKDEQPDLVVTGINHGRNDGICVIYSGTVGAAIEACIAGIPAIAVSLNNHDEEAFMGDAADYAVPIAEHVLKHGLPTHTMLNLNVPNVKPKGLKVCRQAICRFINEYAATSDGRDKTVYWMTGCQEKTIEDEGTDFDFLNEGYATLTPLTIDLTDYSYIKVLETEMEPLFADFSSERDQA